MPIVSDIFELPPFREARLICGDGGLNSPLRHVSVYDSSPEQSDDLTISSGGFFITGFFFVKESVEAMYAYINKLHSIAACGLCIIDEYVNTLPPEIRKLCNEINLPVVIVSKLIPYSDMITSIMELIIRSQQTQLTENKITALAAGHLDYIQKKALLLELNLNFQEHLTVLFCVPDVSSKLISEHRKRELLEALNRDVFSFAAVYQAGILVMASYSDKSTKKTNAKINYLLEKIRESFPHTAAGISNSCLLENCDQAIMQAITCVKVYPLKSGDTIFYHSLGIYRLLSALQGHSELESFYHDILDPIFTYDQDRGSSFFETMTAFLKNGCSFSETGKALYVHENTIRYRMDRIKDLLLYEGDDMEFYQMLSVAIKIHKMKQFI